MLEILPIPNDASLFIKSGMAGYRIQLNALYYILVPTDRFSCSNMVVETLIILYKPQ
jgi:hypothetical protein